MDRAQLFSALSNLPTQDFERLLFAVKPPGGLVPSPEAPQIKRVKALLDWAEGSSGQGIDKVQDCFDKLQNGTLPAAFDFSGYLQFVCEDSRCQLARDLYTETEVLIPLEAETVEKKSLTADSNREAEAPQQKVERFPVLEGLRKYALGKQRQHLLLAGRPGSGKSMTLKRLLLETAEAAMEKPVVIPVYVQLKGDRPIIDLIIAEFRRAKVRVTSDLINEWLFNDQLLLLLDGVNEIPSDEQRRKLQEFREDNPAAPMIFTTRDLAAGGDLGIEKRLEMRPLSETQMREFVQNYLPDHAETLLRQLKDCLREVAETPLLLKMLCDVFDPATEQIPQSKGELFRLFDSQYDKFKGLVAVSDDFRRFKPELLQHLAFSMLQGDPAKPTEPWLTLDRNRAERLLETYLTDRVEAPGQRAKEWLEDLLEHHLLQVASDPKEIEFHHQLFQEYYAAEALLLKLSELLEDEAKFKQDYLNLLKWTESIALMLALVDNEDQALRVVDLAIDVDWMLAARFTRSLGLENQGYIIKCINKSNLPIRFKIKLFGLTGNSNVIPTLMTYIDHNSSDIRETVAQALGTIGCNQSVVALERLVLNEKNIFSIFAVISALEDIGNEIAISVLHKALTRENPSIHERATQALVHLQDKTVLRGLLDDLEENDPKARARAVELLRGLGNAQLIPNLTEVLSDPHPDVKWQAALALVDLGSEAAIPIFINAIYSSGDGTRYYSACKALGKIKSQRATNALFEILEKGDAFDSIEAARALAILQEKTIIPYLIRVLKARNFNLLGISEVFEEFSGSQAYNAIDELALILRNSDYCILARYEAAKSLGKIGCNSNEIISLLLKMSKNEEKLIREASVEALGYINSDVCIAAMREALLDEDYSVRFHAMSGLSRINEFNSQSLVSLIQCLENYEYYEDYNVWRYDDEWSWMAAEVLENLDGSILSSLRESIFSNAWANTPHFNPLMYVIDKVQGCCQYYNHEIFHDISPGKTIFLYFSYAPADEALQTQLANYLAMLERQGIITSWCSHQILHGEDRTQIIHQQLNTADIILLLISPDAISDDTCYHLEIQRAIKRHQSGESRVIPILLRPVDWQGAPFSQLDVLPKNHQPVTTWPNQDQAFQEIAEGIRTVAMEVRKERGGG